MLNNVVGMDFFLQNYRFYWGGMLYLVLYLGCLLYFGRYGSKLVKQIFVWPFVIMLVTAYNPFIMGIVLGQTDWEDRYTRFFWVLPVEFLCSYMLAVLIERQRDEGRKAAVALLAVCMVLVGGNMKIKVIPDENIYKIDDCILELSELIGAEKMTEQPVIVCDPDVYYLIRQYDPTLLEGVNNVEMNIYTGKVAEDIDVSEQEVSIGNAVSMFVRGVEIDTETVKALFQERNVDFFVRNVDYYSEEYVQSLGLSYVGAVEGYEVYRCTKE